MLFIDKHTKLGSYRYIVCYVLLIYGFLILRVCIFGSSQKLTSSTETCMEMHIITYKYEGCPSKSWTFVIKRDFLLVIL